jgi:hypothetical protein
MSPDKQLKNNNQRHGGWKKGQSGNPKGRPRKAECLLDCIKSELLRTNISGRTNEEMIAAALVDLAVRGNLKAIEISLAYTAGKPAQAVVLTGRDAGRHGRDDVSLLELARSNRKPRSKRGFLFFGASTLARDGVQCRSAAEIRAFVGGIE